MTRHTFGAPAVDALDTHAQLPQAEGRNPLADPAVRDAIELLRDSGITADQYATVQLVEYWAVPGVEAPFTDQTAALAAAQSRADHMMQPVTMTRMCGAEGDCAPLDARRVHPRLGDPVPYALYPSRSGGEPVATVDVDGILNWPAGKYPGDPAADDRTPFVLWAGPLQDSDPDIVDSGGRVIGEWDVNAPVPADRAPDQP